MTIAAYLAKCRLRVCVLEDRTEAGGACETAEPLAGARIYPHAQLMYAAPAPGFEQLKLHKYGFRMSWDPRDMSTPAYADLELLRDPAQMSEERADGLLGRSDHFEIVTAFGYNWISI